MKMLTSYNFKALLRGEQIIALKKLLIVLYAQHIKNHKQRSTHNVIIVIILTDLQQIVFI